jgi:DNA-directed RNA polymerase specialized sigma24 family protein
MTLEWVNHTEDRLFKHLSRRERHMIYLFFVREMSWEQISKVFDDMDARGLRRQSRGFWIRYAPRLRADLVSVGSQHYWT